MARAWILVSLAACSSFRAYAPPPARVSPGPATAPGDSCRPPDPQLVDYETRRETAALDAALRAHGGMLLSPQLLDDDQSHPLGAKLRGRAGERLLVIGETRTCNPFIPLAAIDARGEVFTLDAIAQPATKQKIELCAPICGGCGIDSPPASIVVEVPSGAHLGEHRDVTFPMDVQVVFTSAGTCPKVP